jgi:hypothetical protein
MGMLAQKFGPFARHFSRGIGQDNYDFIATIAAGNRESPSQFVSKLCLKIIRNIEMYLKISKSIEIMEPKKTGLLKRNLIIIYTLAFFAASSTR